MIKLIAMDMDGTLLDRNNVILPETKDALMALQRQGIRLVLASGRSYNRLMMYAKELEMDQYGGYLIEINGTAIYDVEKNKREILSQLSVPQAHELFQYFMKWNVEIIGNFDDGMYDYINDKIYQEKVIYRKEHRLPDDFPWTAGPYDFVYDNRNGYPNHIYIKHYEEIQTTVNKVSVAYHEDVIKEVTEIAKRELEGQYWVGLTSSRWLEVMPLGVTKGNGLKMVSSRLGIDLKDMMAFGDGENDMEMLKAAGIGVAMGNALDSVKLCADEVCDSHENNGIAKTLKKYFEL